MNSPTSLTKDSGCSHEIHREKSKDGIRHFQFPLTLPCHKINQFASSHEARRGSYQWFQTHSNSCSPQKIVWMPTQVYSASEFVGSTLLQLVPNKCYSTPKSFQTYPKGKLSIPRHFIIAFTTCSWPLPKLLILRWARTAQLFSHQLQRTPNLVSQMATQGNSKPTVKNPKLRDAAYRILDRLSQAEEELKAEICVSFWGGWNWRGSNSRRLCTYVQPSKFQPAWGSITTRAI
jgi:hypothetical protein